MTYQSAHVVSFDDACALLQQHQIADLSNPIGRRWRDRALTHLCERMDAELRAGETTPFSSEQMVMSMLKSTAAELRAAGQSLETAASRLKHAGAAHGASAAHQASTRALAAAEQLVPEQ